MAGSGVDASQHEVEMSDLPSARKILASCQSTSGYVHPYTLLPVSVFPNGLRDEAAMTVLVPPQEASL